MNRESTQSSLPSDRSALGARDGSESEREDLFRLLVSSRLPTCEEDWGMMSTDSQNFLKTTRSLKKNKMTHKWKTP